MNYIEQAIKEAVEKGYKVPNINLLYTDAGETKMKKPGEIAYEANFRGMWQVICLDPLFWQALGRARGWANDVLGETNRWEKINGETRTFPSNVWAQKMLDFAYHISREKDAESFFKSL